MHLKTLAIVLAGGAGRRLHPLTAHRAKPAVPFGGKYRIIDFTLSNCLHSGLRRILVLTQYKSHSLQLHLRDAWSIFTPQLREYITPVPAQMRTGGSWYAGTADAIYQNLFLLDRSDADWILILSGDHIYRMDYAAMLRFHGDSGADATVACMEVPLAEAPHFGVLATDPDRRVTAFEEKPAAPVPLPGKPTHALASMGIYVFSRDFLCRVLEEDHERPESAHDFGHDILPRLIKSHKVSAYGFGGAPGRVTQDRYWRDVGTLDAYYEANMDLLLPKPPIDFYQDDWPIRGYEKTYPPARTIPSASGRQADLINSIQASGTVVTGATVRHSILFPNVRVEEGAVVEDSLLFESARIGAGARLRRCILDKHVVVPPGETIGYDPVRDAALFTVSTGGVVVVPEGFRFEGEAGA
jgi:glucose-1-phosphate adenylyltransferase